MCTLNTIHFQRIWQIPWLQCTHYSHCEGQAMAYSAFLSTKLVFVYHKVTVLKGKEPYLAYNFRWRCTQEISNNLELMHHISPRKQWFSQKNFCKNAPHTPYIYCRWIFSKEGATQFWCAVPSAGTKTIFAQQLHYYAEQAFNHPSSIAAIYISNASENNVTHLVAT